MRVFAPCFAEWPASPQVYLLKQQQSVGLPRSTPSLRILTWTKAV